MNSEFRLREEIDHNPSSFVDEYAFYRCKDCQKNFLTKDAFKSHLAIDHPFLDLDEEEANEAMSESSVEIIDEFENEKQKAEEIEVYDMNSSTENVMGMNEDDVEPVRKSAKLDVDELSKDAMTDRMRVKIQSMKDMDHDAQLKGKNYEKYNCVCGNAFLKINLLILHQEICKRKVNGKAHR